MREILFRGKRDDNLQWIEGYIYRITENQEMPFLMMKDFHGITYPVYPETVGQYTGLTDKNGKKIFEGDILAGDEYPYSYETAWNYFAEVVWLDDGKAFGLYTFKNPQSNVRGVSHGLTDYMDDFESSEWEIIGNIHDNPEMIGGNKDAFG